MSKDLHSAILFCAFLSSQARLNPKVQHQACAYARPLFSTLYTTTKGRKRDAQKRLIQTDGASNKQNNGLNTQFFDPSYVPRDFRLRHALKSLKKVVNASSGGSSHSKLRPSTLPHPLRKAILILFCRITPVSLSTLLIDK